MSTSYPMRGQLPLQLSENAEKALVAAGQLADEGMDAVMARRMSRAEGCKSFTSMAWASKIGDEWPEAWPKDSGSWHKSQLLLVWKYELHPLGLVSEDGWWLYQLTPLGRAYLNDILEA